MQSRYIGCDFTYGGNYKRNWPPLKGCVIQFGNLCYSDRVTSWVIGISSQKLRFFSILFFERANLVTLAVERKRNAIQNDEVAGAFYNVFQRKTYPLIVLLILEVHIIIVFPQSVGWHRFSSSKLISFCKIISICLSFCFDFSYKPSVTRFIGKNQNRNLKKTPLSIGKFFRQNNSLWSTWICDHVTHGKIT